MAEAFSILVGMAMAAGLLYGAILLTIDKQKAWKQRKVEQNDSSRNI
jgi:hypothetical protein